MYDLERLPDGSGEAAGAGTGPSRGTVGQARRRGGGRTAPAAAERTAPPAVDPLEPFGDMVRAHRAAGFADGQPMSSWSLFMQRYGQA